MSILARGSAKYKGGDGSLLLSRDTLSWAKSEDLGSQKPIPDISIAVQDIKVHCVSAATSKRLLLKVVTASRDPKAAGFVFEFNSKLGAKIEREVLVEALAGIIATTPNAGEQRGQPSKIQSLALKTGANQGLNQHSSGGRTAGERSRGGLNTNLAEGMMSEAEQLKDSEVKMLHENLVGTGVMSNQDFWKQRREELQRKAAVAEKEPAVTKAKTRHTHIYIYE